MPYRIDISSPPADVLDRLIELGALDIEPVSGGVAAIIPDGVASNTVAEYLGIRALTISPAIERDNGSVWMLTPRAIRIGSIVVAPVGIAAPPDALRLTDSTAFGTGNHPTTALCIRALEEALTNGIPASMLDVGTGSGILSLAALKMGVPKAVGLDIDADALKIAAANARLNKIADRLQLVRGGPEVVEGTWPLVVANVLAAPLIDMAPVLVRRLGSRGCLILSGIPRSLESEVRQTYHNLGVRAIHSDIRGGWTALIAEASW